MELKYLLPPLVGAVIGWITNYVAIKLLFRPHNPVKVMGFSIQGLIPKRRAQIAASMAKTIERDLFSSKDIASVIGEVDWKSEVETMVEDLVEHRFTSAKIGKMPLLGILSDNLKSHLKLFLVKEILTQIDSKKHGIREKFQNNVKVREVVVEKIDRLDLRKFEELLQGFISRELRHLEQLGAVMGFLIGLFQSALFYLLANL